MCCFCVSKSAIEHINLYVLFNINNIAYISITTEMVICNVKCSMYNVQD